MSFTSPPVITTQRYPVDIARGTYVLPKVFGGPCLLRGQGRWCTNIDTPSIDTERLCELSDLALSGGLIRITGQYARFTNCRFVNCAVQLDGAWDCRFTNCEFTQYQGIVPLNVTSVSRQTNCLVIENCRFEDPADDNWPTKAFHVALNKGCRKIDIVGCKFHGPRTESHLFADGVTSLRVLDSNFTHGSSTIRLANAKGISLYNCQDGLISRNMIDNFRFGISLTKCRMTLADNVFPKDQPNGLDVFYG